MADLPVRRGGGALGLRRAFDPFERMQEMLGFDPLSILGGMMPGAGRELGFAPDFEVRETQDAFVFKADLPGVDENNIDITINEGRLTVSGRREEETREEGERYYVYERSYGTFNRSFTLPEGVNPDEVQADFNKGVLTLRIPKRAAAQARHIKLGEQKGAALGSGAQQQASPQEGAQKGVGQKGSVGGPAKS